MTAMVTFRFMPSLAREVGAESFVPMPMTAIPRSNNQVTVVGHVRTDPKARLDECKRFEVTGFVRSVTYTVVDKGHKPVAGGGGWVERDMDENITIWLGAAIPN